jgi:hypothetical protein
MAYSLFGDLSTYCLQQKQESLIEKKIPEGKLAIEMAIRKFDEKKRNEREYLEAKIKMHETALSDASLDNKHTLRHKNDITNCKNKMAHCDLLQEPTSLINKRYKLKILEEELLIVSEVLKTRKSS